jgi:hypothetical protein
LTGCGSDVGHEDLRVLRDGLSREILPAQSLMSSTTKD